LRVSDNRVKNRDFLIIRFKFEIPDVMLKFEILDDKVKAKNS